MERIFIKIFAAAISCQAGWREVRRHQRVDAIRGLAGGVMAGVRQNREPI
jgi:hypothetical protein